MLGDRRSAAALLATAGFWVALATGGAAAAERDGAPPQPATPGAAAPAPSEPVRAQVQVRDGRRSIPQPDSLVGREVERVRLRAPTLEISFADG